MSLSMDDKLLGEKVHYYCSSSEDEDGDDDHSGNNSDDGNAHRGDPPVIRDDSSWSNQAESNGIVTNTGPKGVLNDWREYKRMETEKKTDQERERLELTKKLTLTCRSHLNDEQEKLEDEKFLEELDDDFIKEYRLQRIEEMRKALAAVPKFGKLIALTSGNFIQEIDGENCDVTIIVHIYEQSVAACEAMNGCLSCLSSEYPTVKFCRFSASDAQMSLKFASKGVPALLVYKNKELLGNFIRLGEEFGDDFFANDVEAFLQEHGFLVSKESLYTIRDKTTGEVRAHLQEDDDSGSDFDLD